MSLAWERQVQLQRRWPSLHRGRLLCRNRRGWHPLQEKEILYRDSRVHRDSWTLHFKHTKLIQSLKNKSFASIVYFFLQQTPPKRHSSSHRQTGPWCQQTCCEHSLMNSETKRKDAFKSSADRKPSACKPAGPSCGGFGPAELKVHRADQRCFGRFLTISNLSQSSNLQSFKTVSTALLTPHCHILCCCCPILFSWVGFLFFFFKLPLPSAMRLGKNKTTKTKFDTI